MHSSVLLGSGRCDGLILLVCGNLDQVTQGTVLRSWVFTIGPKMCNCDNNANSSTTNWSSAYVTAGKSREFKELGNSGVGKKQYNSYKSMVWFSIMVHAFAE